jgi:predicted DNA-binding WGR domain protein
MPPDPPDPSTAEAWLLERDSAFCRLYLHAAGDRWQVVRHWGRIGTAGRGTTIAFAGYTRAVAKIERIIRQREADGWTLRSHQVGLPVSAAKVGLPVDTFQALVAAANTAFERLTGPPAPAQVAAVDEVRALHAVLADQLASAEDTLAILEQLLTGRLHEAERA